MLEPGDMVSERVRLGERLSRGGMGSVWEGDHLTLQTKVAVKLIALERQGDAGAIARFMSEASAAAQVRSPHVVRTFDHGVTDDGQPFIVMELLEGETLRERLLAKGALSLDEAAMMVRHLGKALGAAHARDIVHRDIKPDNIFFVDHDDDDEVFIKVLDFGLAKRLDLSYGPNTSMGTLIGTPSYMSPEQALSNAELDHRADLWGAAVVAFHALTGEVPFAGETIGSLCVAIAAGDYTPATELRPALPGAVDAFFTKAFQKEIDERFQSASELAKAFAEALQGAARAPLASLPDHPARPEGLEPNPTLDGAVATNPPMNRHRTPLVLGLVAMVALLAMVAFFGSDEPEPRASAAPMASTPSPPPEQEEEAPQARTNDAALPAPDPKETSEPHAEVSPPEKAPAAPTTAPNPAPEEAPAPKAKVPPPKVPVKTRPDDKWAF